MLKDEADTIIDNLKRQLDALQHQLTTRSQTDSTTTSTQQQQWRQELTPQVAGRLGENAAVLASRLASVAKNLNPALREEIVSCQTQAVQLQQSLSGIASRHQVLTDNLSSKESLVSVSAITEKLSVVVKASCSRSIPVRTANLPDVLRISPACLLTITSALSVFASQIFTELTEILLQPAASNKPPALEIILQGLKTTPQKNTSDVVSAALDQSPPSTNLLDILYVDKILAMRGGSMGFASPANKIWAKLPLA